MSKVQIGGVRSLNFRLIPLILLLSLWGCANKISSSEKTPGYNLTAPNSVFILPDTLHEISGLTSIDSVSFACVQDENGILFIYDAVANTIKRQYSFAIDGDYEGIARVNKTIYVLRSDGTLFEIENFESPDFKLTSHVTGIPANNNEGLCYDKDNNRLLIACKGKIGKGPEFKDKRVIYGFDLSSKKLSEQPVFDFDLRQIRQYAINNNIQLPSKIKKNGQVTEPVLKFRPSAICIHPFSKKLYLLSASDHMLFVFKMSGEIDDIVQLDPERFNKSEGITFFENGDMLITNEGQDHKPTLLRFRYGIQ